MGPLQSTRKPQGLEGLQLYKKLHSNVLLKSALSIPSAVSQLQIREA